MRKILTEQKWRVSLQTPQGPIEKVVDAPSQDVASGRAMRSFPGQKFDDVRVNPIDPQSNVPTAQASAQNPLPVQMQPLQPIKQIATTGQILQAKQQLAHESIDIRMINYPYSITLPSRFRRIIYETAPVQIEQGNGQYRVVLENQDEMRRFLLNLQKNFDRSAVKVIAAGIRSSIL
jgi:hypothetical protein